MQLESNPRRSLQLEKAHAWQQRPSAAKKIVKIKNKFFLKKESNSETFPRGGGQGRPGELDLKTGKMDYYTVILRALSLSVDKLLSLASL